MSNKINKTHHWWKSATIYQIYPKSFYDENGDGLGDLKGIIKKIPYLKKLGIDAIWLTPIYPSPQKDGGYDIKDYTTIDSTYGTIFDFKNLINKLHNENIKIILDIVVNHTSTEHFWFQEAKKSKNNPYKDYYIWQDPKNGDVPNNWQSKFGGSAWEYNTETNDYYLHLFDKTQADLNWRNENVQKEVINIMKFWANLGVDGFRLDVINLISKHPNFPNDENGDGRKFYTDGPHVHEYLKLLNKEIFTPYNILTVGEMSSTSIKECILYTNEKEKELNMTFNFHHLKVDYKNGNKWEIQEPNLNNLKQLIASWQEEMNKGGGWNALFWSNHDQPRIVSRYGDSTTEQNRLLSAKMLAIILYGLQGTTYIYQGEELALPNPKWHDITEFKDVESINYYNILIKKGLPKEEVLQIISTRSRDNSRVPMPWNQSKNSGFSENTPWIRNLDEPSKITVENELKNEESIFYFYQKLIALRKTEELLISGTFKRLDNNHDDVFSYERSLHNSSIVIIANMKNYNATFEIPKNTSLNKVDVLISNYKNSQLQKKIVLKPFETTMFKLSDIKND